MADKYWLATDLFRRQDLAKGERAFTRCTHLSQLRDYPFVVALNHGRIVEIDGSVNMCPIDERFYVNTQDDAEWFVTEGYKAWLYKGESEPDRVYWFKYDKLEATPVAF
jgi:hypothetical protein